MAPEQARGRAVDKRADIWAFGVVLYEMLTGRRAFEGDDLSMTLATVMMKEPDWDALPASLPASVRTYLKRCLVKDPRERIRDIGDVRLALAGAFETAASSAAPPVAGVPVKASRRSAIAIAAAALVVGALAAASAVWLQMRPAPAPITRLSVDLGPDALPGNSLTAVISPDGRRIVHVVKGPNGQLLATRLLDQATATPLPGTENGSAPSFSPDSQWILFVASTNQIKKVSVLGGAPVLLCTATNTRGFTWGDDGTIVAALGTNTALVRLPSAGGTPQPLTTLANGEQTHRYPQFLPGGEAVLFTASTNPNQFDDATLQLLSLKTGQVKTLLKGAYSGRYFDGHIVYAHNGVLFGVGFDIKRLEVRGTPVPLLDDVSDNPAFGAGQFSLSQTGTLVYRSGKAVQQGRQIVWQDASGKTTPLLAKAGLYSFPRLSPDGQRLALVVGDAKGWDIYVYDIARDVMSRLTFTGRENGPPVWTPDGTHLAYASTIAPTGLWWLRADGAGEPQHLLEGKAVMIPWSFSPDGRYLSYSLGGSGTKSDIWLLPLDASVRDHPKAGTPEAFLKTPANEGYASFSPDGRWLAYHSDESGRNEVYVRPVRGSAGGKWQVSTNGGTFPFWSRDGRALYYQETQLLRLDETRLMVVDYSSKGEAFTVAKPRAWSDRSIQSFTGGVNSYDLAPDGKRVAAYPLTTATADGSSQHVTFLLNFGDELRRRVPAGK
jgi:WD40 repeat protein